MSRSLEDRLLEALLERRLSNGGFSAYKGGQLAIDATAWASLVLQVVGELKNLEGVQTLLKSQRADGAFLWDARSPRTYWPTYVMALLLAVSEAFPKEREKCVQFLLEETGEHRDKKQEGVELEMVAHDMSIKGWPWVDGTHSWVEPTSMALMALDLLGYAKHPRCKEGRHMLMDRQLPSGGWNIGNTIVFGNELKPMLDSTGLAMSALAGYQPIEKIQGSFDYLHENYRNVRSALCLGWSILGLQAFGGSISEKQGMIEESLELQKKYGDYATPLLALLILTVYFEGGLVEELRKYV